MAKLVDGSSVEILKLDDTAKLDPGKSLAWLVVIQVLLYCLFATSTSLFTITIYFAIIALLYTTWVYLIKEKTDESEPEWLVDQFFCLVQQQPSTGATEHSLVGQFHFLLFIRGDFQDHTSQ